MAGAQAQSQLAVILLLAVFLVSFAGVFTLAGQVSLAFSNLGEIAGELARERYHPANDVLRFLLIMGVPASVLLCAYAVRGTRRWLWPAEAEVTTRSSPAASSHGRWWIKAVSLLGFAWAGVLMVHYSTHANEPLRRPMDTYHEGMSLGAAIDSSHGRVPYRDTVYARGWFQDPGIALAAFRVFGRSIYSVRLLYALLVALAFLLAGAVVAALLRSAPEFLPGALALLLVLTMVRPLGLGFQVIERDIPLFAFLLMVIAAGRRFERGAGALVLLFLLAFLPAAAWAFSIDRGLLLSAASLFVAATGCLVHRPGAVLPPMICGYVAGAVVFGVTIQWQLAPFVSFFTSYVSYLDLLYGIPYPLHRFYAAVPLGLFALAVFRFFWCFLATWRSEGRAPTRAAVTFARREYVALIMLATAVAFFRPALGRSDPDHIQYSCATLYLLLIHLAFKQGMRRRLSRWRWEKLTAAVVGMALLAVCTVWYHRHYDLGKWDFSGVSDESLVPRSYQLTADYLRTALQYDELFYPLTNESCWFYFLNKPCPTRWQLLALAASKPYQREIVQDLERSRTKIVLFRNGSKWNRVVDHTLEERQPIVFDYITRRYRFLRRFEDQELWIRRD